LHVLARALCSLADRLGNFSRFAHAESDTSVVISDDHDGAEPKVAAALDNLGNTAYVDYALVKPRTLIFSISLTRTIWHKTSMLKIEIWSLLPGRISRRRPPNF
jgi:hypothetical protein